MKNFKLLPATLAFILSISAFANPQSPPAAGVGSGGGGDTLGMEVYSQVKRVGMRLMAVSPQLALTPTQRSSLSAVVNTGKLAVMIIDKNLPAYRDINFVQNGVALTENTTAGIFMNFNRDRWLEIKDLQKKEALIAHEILVSAGIEKTGEYGFTRQYEELAKNLASASQLQATLKAEKILDVASFESVLVINPYLELRPTDTTETSSNLQLGITSSQNTDLIIGLNEIICRELGFGPYVRNSASYASKINRSPYGTNTDSGLNISGGINNTVESLNCNRVAN
jgi:hypothetical protein